ncbi:MAG TPA: hypothetical protein VFN57_07460 [Thermomicrobiaceae bacterium]|nr:hypothetical protein [Thermomicrobiaceae bacterium]
MRHVVDGGAGRRHGNPAAAQDLTLEALGADPWDWVQAMRDAVGPARWSTYWRAYAALPIARALRLLRPAPVPVIVAVRGGPGRSLPARLVHGRSRQLGMRAA